MTHNIVMVIENMTHIAFHNCITERY